MVERKILIADDDAEDRFIIQDAMETYNADDVIIFADNGEQLLNMLKQNFTNSLYPCLIVLDLNMPKKDGREALKEIKQHPVFKKIPVVVFTTTKSENEIKRCYELGANTYVVKPVSPNDLLSLISEKLKSIDEA